MPKPHDPALPQRKSVRLKGWDYTQQGVYFITICAHERQCLFGTIADGEIRMNDSGMAVSEEWLRTSAVHPYVTLDVCVVMLNHLHGLIILNDPPPPSPRATPTIGSATSASCPRPAQLYGGSLGAIVGQFKSTATKRVNLLRRAPGLPVWQRGYHEHIVRNDGELAVLREYVANNAARWAEDVNHPSHVSPLSR